MGSSRSASLAPRKHKATKKSKNADTANQAKDVPIRANRSSLPPKFGVDTDYWSEYNKLADDHDKEWTGTLNAHLDNLLIFAGLFASINTAFIVLSLDLLKATPSDETNNLLRLLLLSGAVGENNINTASPPWQLEDMAVQTSYLFSSSLSCTLLAALGGLVGKQWVVFYQKPGKTKTADERAIIRQKKYDGVKIYYFRSLLDTLSFLIQLAVLLFLLGFMFYLWDLHEGVAIMVIVISTAGFLVYLGTLWAASYDEYCPFQTPLSMAIRKFLDSTRPLIHSLFSFTSTRWRNGVGWVSGVGKARGNDVEMGDAAVVTGTRSLAEIRSVVAQEGEPSQSAPEGLSKSSKASELESPIENQDLLHSYVKSLRWVFKTASHEVTLLEAAWNLPALRQANLTRVVFQKQAAPGVSRFTQIIKSTINWIPYLKGHTTPTVNSIYTTPTYRRLVTLLRDSLVRLLLAGDVNNSTAAEDALVYGRAVLHCLVQSHKATEGFALLSSELKNYIPYGWRSTRGELRVLLACVQNESGYWENVEDVGNSEVNISVLPIYVASMSIVCPPRYYGRWMRFVLDQWLRASMVIPPIADSDPTRSSNTASPVGSASAALSQSTVTPRILGLTAISLVRGRFLENEDKNEDLTEALRPFVWKQYEGDSFIYYRILEALEAYPGLDCTLILNPSPGPEGDFTSPGIEFAWLPKRVPIAEENEAYAAFIKGVAHSIDMLVDGTDDYQLPFHRNNRIQHRSDLRGHLGQKILTVMQNILPSVLSQDLSTEYCRSLVEETISFIGKATNKEMWNLTSDGLPPDLIWHAASQIQKGSIAMDDILTLMKDATSEGDLFYDDLFRQHPKAASMLMASLYDERPEVRGISSELFQKNGHLWFDITEEGNQDLHLFGDRELSDALTKHIKMRKQGDDPDPIMDIVDIVRRRGKLTERLLDGLYEVVVGPEMDAGMDRKEVLETSLEIWAGVVEQLSDDSQMRWQSANMMMALNEYIKNLKDEYEVADWNRKQALQFPRWLEKYHQRVDENRDSSTTAMMYWFAETYHQYHELISPSSATRI